MSWNGSGGYNYNVASVLASAPAQSGVYVIYAPGRNVYVGESGDIRTRLMQHLNGDNPCIGRSGATLFAFELVPAATRVTRQDALILEMHPSCNQRLG
jgi:excinuclease UvrABC nuclease subunit